jgi:hypothetical protein
VRLPGPCCNAGLLGDHRRIIQGLRPPRYLDDPFLAQRLREHSLFRAVTIELPWLHEELLAATTWLQLRVAAGTNAEAAVLLAEAGRTKRVRCTARSTLGRRPERPADRAFGL